MKNKHINLNKLKKILSEKSQKELTKEIVTLFKIFPDVKDYFTITLDDKGAESILNKYKEIITNEFFPKRGHGKAKLAVAKKAIRDFKKISNSIFNNIDIMLHYVEQGVMFTNVYGDINEEFYNSMEMVYEDAIKLISKNKLKKEFKNQSYNIVLDACDSWGFKEQLECLYDEYLENSSI